MERFKGSLVILGVVLGVFGLGLTPLAFALPPGVLTLPWAVPAMTGDELSIKVGSALNSNPNITTTAALDNASWTEIPATDLISNSATNKASMVQMLVVTNFESTGKVCITTTARADDNCGNDTQPSVTCTATPTQGDASVVLAGTQREFRFDGTRCLWARASVASSDAQFELVIR